MTKDLQRLATLLGIPEPFSGGSVIVEAAIKRIKLLERQLAESDGMLAAHASAIDKTPPSDWPKDSHLRRAIARHVIRTAKTI